MVAEQRHPPSVSVVIPVKDDAAQLRRCLRAIAEQSRAPDEIIVVDNGSDDDSRAVAEAAGARVLRCARPGIPAASACGYDAAVGDLVLRLDADCLPDPRWVQSVVAGFEVRPDVAAFTGGARFIDGPRMLRTPLAVIYLAAYLGAAGLALGHLPLFGSNLALRREAWRNVRAAVRRDDPEIHDDFDLSFPLGERYRIRLLPHTRMGISMRPFASAPAMLRRLRRGMRTVLQRWPHDLPPVRWTRLALRRARGARGARGGAGAVRRERRRARRRSRGCGTR